MLFSGSDRFEPLASLSAGDSMTGYSAGGHRMGYQVGQLGAILAVVAAAAWGCTTDIAPIGSNAEMADSGGEAGSPAREPAGDGALGEGGSGSENTGGQAGPPVAGSGNTPTPPAGWACDDGVLNGDETDVDCGGETCGACGVNQRCRQFTDCLSEFCLAELCAPPVGICGDGIGGP